VAADLSDRLSKRAPWSPRRGKYPAAVVACLRRAGVAERGAMNVVVCVKYVPNPQGTPELGPDHLVIREGVDGALDPGDEFAVEAALRLLEAHGGEVRIVSMGPEIAMTAIRRAFAMGAHTGVLVTDPALRGADALTTARVLAAAIRRSEFDLVLTGVESTDGSTGTVAATVAELLGLPAATYARAVEIAGGTLRVERQTEGGYDLVEAPLPALASVTGSAAEPRYPTLKGIMQAKQKPVEQLTLSDLGVAHVAPTQRVVAADRTAERGPGEVVPADDAAIARAADLLVEARVI
jgi:electron transfer flavoprotein beta subunit